MRGLFGLLFLLRIMLGSFKIARSSFVAELRGPWDEGQKMRIRIVCFVPLTPSSMLLSYSVALRATFNLWTWLLATADERRNAVGLVDFFGTKNRRDVSVQKLKRRRKWTRWHFRMLKKSLGHHFAVRTFTLEVVHDPQDRGRSFIWKLAVLICGDAARKSLFGGLIMCPGFSAFFTNTKVDVFMLGN